MAIASTAKTYGNTSQHLQGTGSRGIPASTRDHEASSELAEGEEKVPDDDESNTTVVSREALASSSSADTVVEVQASQKSSSSETP